ncbi:hypothetical protein FIBSPDRAFT_1051021 [Athelia psychrophila]|uniref:Uncharacterized protein n=1 Tax=Athelia psychrophila TaxID=1759441 RepID=A0A165ZSY7_9AGAM|nr:hypothetical protein FIBSPDRAFT_1051021 [Fibularhizoctonia sp. CBS 109695]
MEKAASSEDQDAGIGVLGSRGTGTSPAPASTRASAGKRRPFSLRFRKGAASPCSSSEQQAQITEDDKRVVKKRKENATRTVKPTPRASTNRYATRSAPCRASSPLVEDSEKISTVHVQSVPIAPIDELPVVNVDIDLQTAPTPSVHTEEPAVSVLPDTQEELDVVIALAPAARHLKYLSWPLASNFAKTHAHTTTPQSP